MYCVSSRHTDSGERILTVHAALRKLKLQTRFAVCWCNASMPLFPGIFPNCVHQLLTSLLGDNCDLFYQNEQMVPSHKLSSVGWCVFSVAGQSAVGLEFFGRLST